MKDPFKQLQTCAHYAEQAREAVTVKRMTEIAERCDRCGAAGQARYLLTSGGELVMCLHHARQHEPNLLHLLVQRETTDTFDKAMSGGVRV